MKAQKAIARVAEKLALAGRPPATPIPRIRYPLIGFSTAHASAMRSECPAPPLSTFSPPRKIIVEIWIGNLDSKIANSIGYLETGLLRALEISELEKRLVRLVHLEQTQRSRVGGVAESHVAREQRQQVRQM